MQFKTVSPDEVPRCQTVLLTLFSLALTTTLAAAAENLLKNPGLEETKGDAQTLSDWVSTSESAGKAVLAQNGISPSGAHAVSIPPNTSIEQKIEAAPAGPYLAR